jgi:hypothetical protein
MKNNPPPLSLIQRPGQRPPVKHDFPQNHHHGSSKVLGFHFHVTAPSKKLQGVPPHLHTRSSTTQFHEPFSKPSITSTSFFLGKPERNRRKAVTTEE